MRLFIILSLVSWFGLISNQTGVLAAETQPISQSISQFVSQAVSQQKALSQHQSDQLRVQPTTQFDKAEQYEALPAGALTHHKIIDVNAFSQASTNMSFERELNFKIGNAFFRRLWVSSPSSTQASDGLGPLFNARACQRCHIKDGRGHPPHNATDNNVSMLLRLSIPAQNATQQQLLTSRRVTSIDEPNYGGQLQDRSVANLPAEGQFEIDYTEESIELSDGEIVSLRKPHIRLKNLRYGDMHPDTMVSARIAPQMIGLGLLEAIAESDILQQEDIADRNQDGVSGKANRVWSRLRKQVMLGRFGLKAGMPTLDDQNQAAFSGDIGLSTPLFPQHYSDCTEKQSRCRKMPHGNSQQYDDLEAHQEVTDLVLHYSRNLSVPPRRGVNDPGVLAGKKLFYQSGCIACHTPKYITPVDTEQPEQSRQLIWPYTDLLLHDMGEGLADHRPEGLANGSEWRTPPLWGIGLTPLVNGHSFYLHDGRARNLLEAILWHGGEAKAAQQHVVAMNKKQRQQLLSFIRSL